MEHILPGTNSPPEAAPLVSYTEGEANAVGTPPGLAAPTPGASPLKAGANPQRAKRRQRRTRDRADYPLSVDDAELLAGIRAGDEQSWTVLVHRHSDLVFRIARSVTNDDASASDAMQGTWFKLLENVDRVENPKAVRGWLATTARREAIALSKRTSRQSPNENISLLADRQQGTIASAHKPSADPFEFAAKDEQVRILLAELDQLGDKCRTLLTLFAHNFSYAEIAEILDMAPGSVGPSRNRCLDKLRRSPRIAQFATPTIDVRKEDQ